jgi:hypothetical protein
MLVVAVVEIQVVELVVPDLLLLLVELVYQLLLLLEAEEAVEILLTVLPAVLAVEQLKVQVLLELELQERPIKDIKVVMHHQTVKKVLAVAVLAGQDKINKVVLAVLAGQDRQVQSMVQHNVRVVAVAEASEAAREERAAQAAAEPVLEVEMELREQQTLAVLVAAAVEAVVTARLVALA